MTERINNIFYKEKQSERERIASALEFSVEEDRIKPIDFIGRGDFTREYINKTNSELSRKLSFEDGVGDEDSNIAEWEFTYVLNHGRTIPGCKANLASSYDDHINGIDIVCSLENTNSEQPYVFGIDVSTATLPEAVSKKFARGDHPRGDVPTGCSRVIFYEDKEKNHVTSIEGIPRFVLGSSPLFVGHQKYLDKFFIKDDDTIRHKVDRDLRFNVLSSLFIQSIGLMNNLQKRPTGEETVRKRAIETCDAVRLATGRSLYKLMDVHKEKGEDFETRFNEELTKARKITVNGSVDDCYNMVLRESMMRQKS